MNNATAPANPMRTILDNLRQPIEQQYIKHRDGDRGKTFTVAYIEWHHAADLLDRHAPTWTYEVIRLDIGDNGGVVCQARMTINGVSRDNFGVSQHADLEVAVKDAVSDALKRCAVLFGVGRDLYAKSKPGAGPAPAIRKPENGKAGTPADAITAGQRSAIITLCQKANLSHDELASGQFGCSLDKLNKAAASYLITYLQKG